MLFKKWQGQFYLKIQSFQLSIDPIGKQFCDPTKRVRFFFDEFVYLIQSYEMDVQLVANIISMHINPKLAFHTQDQTHAHSSKCFAIACMDFRLVDDTTYFMNSLGFNNNYDQFILAGASLGFSQDKYPYWGQALIDHMAIGQSLHHFKEIIFIDHRDCGAYKKFYPEITAENEMEYHQKHMQMAHDRLGSVFPNFKFRGYLMDIEGKCVEIHVKGGHRIQAHEAQEDPFLASIQH